MCANNTTTILTDVAHLSCFQFFLKYYILVVDIKCDKYYMEICNEFPGSSCSKLHNKDVLKQERKVPMF